MTQPIAVILRGPMGVGKTTIGQAILSKGGFHGSRPILLDDGWLINAWRYSTTGTSRYRDLATSTLPVLVAELGCGEPVDLLSNGATRNPMEWMRVLQSVGREVYCFRLWSSWCEIEERMRGFRPAEILQAKLWYCAYDKNDPVVTFPPGVEISEHQIDRTKKTDAEVVTEIGAIAGFD
jgi:hypothetical protein